MTDRLNGAYLKVKDCYQAIQQHQQAVLKFRQAIDFYRLFGLPEAEACLSYNRLSEAGRAVSAEEQAVQASRQQVIQAEQDMKAGLLAIPDPKSLNADDADVKALSALIGKTDSLWGKVVSLMDKANQAHHQICIQTELLVKKLKA